MRASYQSIFIRIKTYSFLVLLLLGNIVFYACDSKKIGTITEDEISSKEMANSPVSIEVNLDNNKLREGEERHFGLSGYSINGERIIIPIQLGSGGNKSVSQVVLMMPDSISDLSKYQVIDNDTSFKQVMRANKDPESGQIIITENEKKVLQYNYHTVYEKNVIRQANANFDNFTRSEADTFVTTSKYAVPRSDYIHPLYGLEGEMMTRDWPVEHHPHHRGIYWAWPEVKYGSERGDLHALQRVFARPSGSVQLTDGPVYAQIVAENLWMWEDDKPIVREHAAIRVYRKRSDSRIIDLALKFVALKDSITIATRHTDSYGGLNMRFQTPDSQNISYFTSKSGSNPQRAWAYFSGNFIGAETTTGMMILQHQQNPEYPGEWVEYPDLSWLQPTFPTPGTRYQLNKEDPLILRYRLITHKGGKPSKETLRKKWDAFNNESSPLLPLIME